MTDKERIAELERENKELHETIRRAELALYGGMGYVITPSVWQACDNNCRRCGRTACVKLQSSVYL